MAARALILANGSFTDPAIPALQSPVPDGARLKALFERADVFPYEATLLPDLGAQAMREAVADFFDNTAADDLVLLYISGHGFKDSANKLYFAANDTRKNQLKATALDARFVIECMQECRAARQLLFLDTCYSGAFARGTTFKSAAQTVAKDDFGRPDDSVDWAGRGVVTASTAVQFAEEAAADGYVQSRFTRHLITGIEAGLADRRQCGQIALEDLVAHVRSALKAEGAKQAPQFFGEKLTGEIVLARNPVAISLSEDVATLLRSPSARDRAEAVDRLAVLARSEAHGVSRLALEQLESLVQDDDSVSVQAAASLALKKFGRAPAATQPKAVQETDRPKINRDLEEKSGKFFSISDDFQENYRLAKELITPKIALGFLAVVFAIFAIGPKLSQVFSFIAPPTEQIIPAEVTEDAAAPPPQPPASSPAASLEGTWALNKDGSGRCNDTTNFMLHVRPSAGQISVNGGKAETLSSPDADGWMAVDGAWWRLEPDGTLLVNSVKVSAGATEFVRCPF